MELKEGIVYDYKIKKFVELSDKEAYYVLEDETGRRYLLNSEYYKNYNFEIGQTISCRIDHINCSGKIFLEPEHPHYEEGEQYSFKVELSYLSVNRFGKDVRILEVKDAFGEIAVCKIEDPSVNFTAGEETKFKVERIKKGKLYLSHSKDRSFPILNIGGFYKFKIIDLKDLADSRTYYILQDDNKNSYLLNSEYYDHHDLALGKEVECVIQKFSSKGYYVLEPRHPFYEINKEYHFEIDRQFAAEKEKITGAFEVVVKDVYNEEVRFVNKHKIEGSKIICKVSGIKKGKPLLAFVSLTD